MIGNKMPFFSLFSETSCCSIIGFLPTRNIFIMIICNIILFFITPLWYFWEMDHKILREGIVSFSRNNKIPGWNVVWNQVEKLWFIKILTGEKLPLNGTHWQAVELNCGGNSQLPPQLFRFPPVLAWPPARDLLSRIPKLPKLFRLFGKLHTSG